MDEYRTHPDCNVSECLDRLRKNFPASMELLPSRLREWQIEFGGRPAGACIRALDVILQSRGNAAPEVKWFVEVLAERAEAVAEDQYERTKKYMAEMEAHREPATASRQRNLDWCRARKAENPGAFAKLHEAAVNDWGVINPATRKKWLDADPCESLAVASLVRAHCER